MKPRQPTEGRIALLALLVCLSIALVLRQAWDVTLAQSGDGYSLSWWTVDGGGDTSASGEGYSLDGTIGQHDAGVVTGGDYTLVSGFWGGVAVDHNVYLPLILRAY